MDSIAASERTEYIREVIVNYKGPRRKSPEFNRSEAVTDFIRRTLIDNAREHFIVLFLDLRNRVIGYSISGIGTKDRCPLHGAEIFQKAVLIGAASIIVAHNHPSQDLRPSEPDKAVTKRLYEAGELLGIPLLDHIIVTEDAHYSFCDHGGIPHDHRGRDGMYL